MELTEPELKALMLDSLDGDQRAHATMLRAFAERLRSFFCRRVGDSLGEVDDLVQESLIAIHNKRSTFDTSQPVTPWVYAIARHKLADHFRRRNRYASQPLEQCDEPASEFESASSARLDLGRLLGLLPPKQRLAIWQTKIEGESVAAVAEKNGMTVADVKVSVHRGLKALTGRIVATGI